MSKKPNYPQDEDDDIQFIHQTIVCPLCLKPISEKDIQEHFTLRHAEYECPYCQRSFDQNSELAAHVQQEHSDPPQEYSCPVCSESFKDESLLQTHVNNHFDDQTVTPRPVLPTSSREEAKSRGQVLSNQSENSIRAQLDERRRNESLRFQLYKESNHENNQENFETESQLVDDDFNYAAEYEHEWLKQQYGMTDVSASSRAQSNLDRLYKQQKIDIVTYQNERDLVDKKMQTVIDDLTTCTPNLIQSIRSAPLTGAIAKRYTCTSCDHFSSSFIDSGYGCGYRNTQMLLSSLREDASFRSVLFNNGNMSMPSIFKIQDLIESAWSKGFDQIGRSQLGGKLKNTAKWIGSTDIAAMFLSLRIRVELVDIKAHPKGPSVSSVLLNYVREYFERETASGRFIHPIYLQHQGHSRTIVGLEVNNRGECSSLLIMDPGTRKAQIDQGVSKKSLLSLLRRGAATLSKKEYQLLVIRGRIDSDNEYQASKVLKSTRL